MKGSDIGKTINFVSGNDGRTEEFGWKIGELLEEGDVVCLTGELGAGKTCLVRGIVSCLQRSAVRSPVKSPSYTILNIYEGTPVVYHFDFYRLEDQDDIEYLGLNDYWGKGVCVVEWPGRLCVSLPGRRIDVIIKITAEMERMIIVSFPDDD